MKTAWWLAGAHLLSGVLGRWKTRSAPAIRELAGLVVQRQEARIGKRACAYRERVSRHAPSARAFDEDNTNWLCTTISAFLLIIETLLI
jgi:hypothetical protein